MRIAIALVIAVAIAVAAFAVVRHDRSEPQTAGALTLVGDSLNVGVEPYLDDELPAGGSTRTTSSGGRPRRVSKS